jgi:23S rRNA pseudouridine2605 synthase
MADTDVQAATPKQPRIRLQKFLAACGLGSRRACEELITAGRVSIDGVVAAELGRTVEPTRQQVELDGEPLRMERKKYYALNKPRGVVCTNRDPSGRPRIIDMFPPNSPRLFSVGRLDEDSEGLIVVTNDGDLAQKLAHPKFRIYRTYHVQVAGVPNRPALESLEKGEYFSEGKFRVQSAKILKKQGKSCFLEIVLGEGHNREIRRLFARIGHKVMKLKRVAFGPIKLGKLHRGEVRELTRDELATLHSILLRNQQPGERRPGKPKRAAREESQNRPQTRKPAPKRGAAPATDAAVRPGKRRPLFEDFEEETSKKPHPALAGQDKARRQRPRTEDRPASRGKNRIPGKRLGKSGAKGKRPPRGDRRR